MHFSHRFASRLVWVPTLCGLTGVRAVLAAPSTPTAAPPAAPAAPVAPQAPVEPTPPATPGPHAVQKPAGPRRAVTPPEHAAPAASATAQGAETSEPSVAGSPSPATAPPDAGTATAAPSTNDAVSAHAAPAGDPVEPPPSVDLDEATTAASKSPPDAGSRPRRYGLPPPAAPTKRSPRPEPVGLSAGLQSTQLWNRDEGYRAFSETGSDTRTGLFANYEVWRERSFHVTVGLGWDYEHTVRGILNGAAEAELRAHNFYLAGQGDYDLLSWLSPYGRVATGWSSVRATVDANAANYISGNDQAQNSPFASLGLGVDFHTARGAFRRSSLSLGGFVEGGYAVGSSLDLELSRRGADDLAVKEQTPALGEVGRSGGYLRFGAYVGF